MRPEMLVCDQISRMVGAPLDEEGIHRFLRGLAQVLEAEPISMYGPGLRSVSYTHLTLPTNSRV